MLKQKQAGGTVRGKQMWKSLQMDLYITVKRELIHLTHALKMVIISDAFDLL